MRISDVDGISKTILKKDKIPFYKAFIIENSDETMNINSHVDILALSEDAAIERLVNELPLEKAMALKGQIVSFAIIKVAKESLDTVDLVDEGDVYYENNNISITLQNKIYKVGVEDKRIDELDIVIDEKTEKRICSNLKLSKI